MQVVWSAELNCAIVQSQREVKRFFKREKRKQQHREQVAAAEANAFQLPRSALGVLDPSRASISCFLILQGMSVALHTQR